MKIAQKTPVVGAKNSLLIDREFQTVCFLMGQEVTRRVPGRNPLSAAEFAVISALRSFRTEEILGLKKAVKVEIRMKGGQTHKFYVRVVPPDMSRVHPSWGVRAQLMQTRF